MPESWRRDPNHDGCLRKLRLDPPLLCGCRQIRNGGMRWNAYSNPMSTFYGICDDRHAWLSRNDICFRKCPGRLVEGFGFAYDQLQECLRVEKWRARAVLKWPQRRCRKRRPQVVDSCLGRQTCPGKDVCRMASELRVLKPLDDGPTNKRGDLSCFCERPATHYLPNTDYYYCAEHAEEAGRLYAAWVLNGGERHSA